MVPRFAVKSSMALLREVKSSMAFVVVVSVAADARCRSISAQKTSSGEASSSTASNQFAPSPSCWLLRFLLANKPGEEEIDSDIDGEKAQIHGMAKKTVADSIPTVELCSDSTLCLNFLLVLLKQFLLYCVVDFESAMPSPIIMNTVLCRSEYHLSQETSNRSSLRSHKIDSMSKAALSGLDPLKDLLGDVISRLEVLESKVGLPSGSSHGVSKPMSSPVPSKAKLAGTSSVHFLVNLMPC